MSTDRPVAGGTDVGIFNSRRIPVRRSAAFMTAHSLLVSGLLVSGLLVSGLLVSGFIVVPARAQDYPNRPIKVVVPLAPGGGTDLLARLIGQKLAESMGQPVIVENRPGASTMIGAEMVAKAAPDGYTLLSTAATTFAVNPSLYKKMPYDAANDFAPITMTARFSLALVVGADFPAATMKEFIAVAKSKPRELNFASPGQASTHHLVMELFMQRAGIQMMHIPYKGAGPAVQDLLAGRVPTMFLDLATGNEHIKSGRIRALGIATPTRFPELPQLPTIGEAGVETGLQGFEGSAWQGIVAPARTPSAIVNKLNTEIAKALADPAMKQKLYAAGIEPLKTTPEEFAAYIRSETVKWADVISRAKISLQ